MKTETECTKTKMVVVVLLGMAAGLWIGFAIGYALGTMHMVAAISDNNKPVN